MVNESGKPLDAGLAEFDAAVEKARDPRQKELEEKLKALGLDDQEHFDYKMSRFDLKRRRQAVLPTATFRHTREVGQQLAEAERKVAQLEEKFPALKETYDGIMVTDEKSDK